MENKAAIWQSKDEYPSLHVMITNNPRYLKGRATADDIEKAVQFVRKWLEANFK